MFIRELNLKGFRGAKALPLELHEKLNVFVGMNGAGKSSVLDATAILLSWLANRIKRTGASGRPISEWDIKNDATSSDLHISLDYKGDSIGWNLTKVRKGHSRKELVSFLINMSGLAKRVQVDSLESIAVQSLPLFAYYPVNRSVLDIPLRIRGKHRFDIFSAYDDSLTSGANFRTFFEWYREREDLENENRVLESIGGDLPDGVQVPDRHLECVREALYGFMPGFERLTVRRQPLRMEVLKNGVRLTVNQLSDGEKCLMALIGDLARRLAIANPERSNPLEGDGIVLIDEIDLHLHPRWQRMVVPKLLEVFPNCQFLISTHSPHVITHVKPESLFLLRLVEGEIKVLRPEESYGKTVDRVLEDLMGVESTRPDEVIQSIQEIYTEIDQGRYGNARSMIDRLEQTIGEDPELTRAEVLIKRKELIGK